MFERDASIGENSLQQDFRIDVGMKSIGDVLEGMALSNLNISSDVTGAKSEKHFEGSIVFRSCRLNGLRSYAAGTANEI